MKNYQKLIAASLLLGGAVLARKNFQQKKEIEALSKKAETDLTHRSYGDRQVYLLGNGLEMLSAAVFLICDAHFPPENIHFYQDTQKPSPADFGNSADGFFISTPYSIYPEYNKNLLDLMDLLPSTSYDGWTLKKEILQYGKAHPTLSGARLIGSAGEILRAEHLELNANDRASIYGIITTPEILIGERALNEWFGPHFFETNFWILCQTTFGLQKWSSLAAFKRRIHRMLEFITKIHNPEGIVQTAKNRTSMLISPLLSFLKEKGVHFHEESATDIRFTNQHPFSVRKILFDDKTTLSLNTGDLCFITTDSPLSNVYYGDLTTPPPSKETDSSFASLWEQTSKISTFSGKPDTFFENTAETSISTFTITLKSDKFLHFIEQFSGNLTGSSGLMTFKSSHWILSFSIPPQPYFENADGTYILWGYGLAPKVLGNYIKKPMGDCTGLEILEEFFYHLHLDNIQKKQFTQDILNVIPAYFPFATAPVSVGYSLDRSQLIPLGTENFAVLGSLTSLPTEIPSTEEYLVYGARLAVNQLMGIKKPLPAPVVQNTKLVLAALKAAYRK